MTREEQKTFVVELTENIAEKVQKYIESEKIPAEWNGLELRILLKELFDDAADFPSVKVKEKTVKEYLRFHYL